MEVELHCKSTTKCFLCSYGTIPNAIKHTVKNKKQIEKVAKKPEDHVGNLSEYVVDSSSVSMDRRYTCLIEAFAIET